MEDGKNIEQDFSGRVNYWVISYFSISSILYNISISTHLEFLEVHRGIESSFL